MHINGILTNLGTLSLGVIFGSLLIDIARKDQEVALSDLRNKNASLQMQHSLFKNENIVLQNQVKDLLAERIRIATQVLARESFHLVGSDVTTIRFSRYDGTLLWFTEQGEGISYSQLQPNNDPGIDVSDGTIVSKPQTAAAFMLKGKSADNWSMTFATK